MADLTVLVPSRGRPEKVVPLAEAFKSTCTAGTEVVFAIDSDDPRRPEYLDAVLHQPGTDVVVGDTHNFVQALNLAAEGVTTFAVGFMGDDHCPRTHGWDATYIEALDDLGTGIVYGDDMLQGDRIPTQVAMTTDIVRALGWMAPPDLVHLFVDNFWKDLGTAAGCLRYLPDVIVEHRHPVAGKAAWDEGYARVNDSAMYARDGAAYQRFVASGELHSAVEVVKTLRAAHV